MSSFEREAFGIGGRVLLIELRERVGEGSADVFSGVGLRGLHAGRGVAGEGVRLVWTFNGDEGGAGRAAGGAARKGLFELLAYVVDGRGAAA